MKKSIGFIFLLCYVLMMSMCRKPDIFPEEGYDERLSGGLQTAFDATSQSFTHEFEGMSQYDELIHELGDAAFEQTFVTAPAPINNGLGPIYNNVSCISCHHNDGKGVPSTGGIESSLLVRISQPGVDEHGGPLGIQGFGGQLQDKAVFGKLSECNVDITYAEQTYTFPDGTTYKLRTPTYTLNNLYQPIVVNYLLSPRLAPPVFGLGLLAAIPENQILAHSDINDRDGDGISGKPNYVWDPEKEIVMLGRFGLKANTATLMTQVAAAYNNDMGITNRIFKHDPTYNTSQWDSLGDDPELPDSILNAVKFYIQTLQVPARRNVNLPDVLSGKKIFMEAKCGSCHIPTFTTEINVALPSISNQRIQPYSDLLVHDMGPGLADNRPDYDADGTEWRTAPLWGIGLFETVNYPAYYLHDGRARTITEAIMWHGGEAEFSKNFVAQLNKSDRDALLKFLKSL
ncbi:di-heme oxidoredictase family protein [soil metagenome]